MYTARTVKLLTKTKSKYYEQGERMGKVLAQQIKKQVATRMITEIRTSTGQIMRDPKEINSTFKSFYADLYTSESKKNPTLFEIFFTQV